MRVLQDFFRRGCFVSVILAPNERYVLVHCCLHKLYRLSISGNLIGADLQAVLEYPLIFPLGRLDFLKTAKILEFVCSKKLGVRITELHQRIMSAESFCGTMSALGQKQTFALRNAISAFTSKADIGIKRYSRVVIAIP